MLVTKCDICKKEIKDRETEIKAGRGMFANNSFCSRCGKPISDFLKSHGLGVDAVTRARKKLKHK